MSLLSVVEKRLVADDSVRVQTAVSGVAVDERDTAPIAKTIQRCQRIATALVRAAQSDVGWGVTVPDMKSTSPNMASHEICAW